VARTGEVYADPALLGSFEGDAPAAFSFSARGFNGLDIGDKRRRYLSTGSLDFIAAGDSHGSLGVFEGVVGTVVAVACDTKLSSASPPSNTLPVSSLMWPRDPPCSYDARRFSGI